jgi:hypothetical protein
MHSATLAGWAQFVAGPGGSISKKLLEPLRRQRRVARRILNVAMPEVGLDRPRVVAVVGELIAAGVAEHVGVNFDTEASLEARALDHAREAGGTQRRPRSDTNTKGD